MNGLKIIMKNLTNTLQVNSSIIRPIRPQFKVMPSFRHVVICDTKNFIRANSD